MILLSLSRSQPRLKRFVDLHTPKLHNVIRMDVGIGIRQGHIDIYTVACLFREELFAVRVLCF
jgi:hypothetical protein